MSAGSINASSALALLTDDMTLLAPLFRQAVDAALAQCNSPPNMLNAVVYETYRSNDLQALYFARGRDVRPPEEPVTNARTNLSSWHGYGLAVDVIHRDKKWDAGGKWFRDVARIFKQHGCKWGGDWTTPDVAHFQWGLCKPSPSPVAQQLLKTRGVEAVWEAVGAKL